MVLSVLVWLYFVFFFKQKTAYEMRISDWSSDVCSSDLRSAPPAHVRAAERERAPVESGCDRAASTCGVHGMAETKRAGSAALCRREVRRRSERDRSLQRRQGRGRLRHPRADLRRRSEIGRAHVCTPVTKAKLVCRLLLAKKKK